MGQGNPKRRWAALRIQRIERRAFNNPVYVYLKWRSYQTDATLSFRGEWDPCPICGQVTNHKDRLISAPMHYYPIGDTMPHGHKIDGSIAFRDIYWGWECSTMFKTPWHAYRDDLPGLERFARWWQAAFYRKEEPSVADLFYFIGTNAWRYRCEEVYHKREKNFMREHAARILLRQQQEEEEERYLYLHFKKRFDLIDSPEARQFARNMIDLDKLKRRLRDESGNSNVQRKQRANETAHGRRAIRS